MSQAGASSNGAPQPLPIIRRDAGTFANDLDIPTPEIKDKKAKIAFFKEQSAGATTPIRRAARRQRINRQINLTSAFRSLLGLSLFFMMAPAFALEISASEICLPHEFFPTTSRHSTMLLSVVSTYSCSFMLALLAIVAALTLRPCYFGDAPAVQCF